MISFFKFIKNRFCRNPEESYFNVIYGWHIRSLRTWDYNLNLLIFARKLERDNDNSDVYNLYQLSCESCFI